MVIPSLILMQVYGVPGRIHAWEIIEGGHPEMAQHSTCGLSVTHKWILGCTPRTQPVTSKGEVSLGLLSCCPRRLAHSNHNPRCYV